MALKARYAKLSDVPQDLRSLYRAENKTAGDDSPAILDVEAVDGLGLVNQAALMAQVTKAQADFRRANDRLQRYKKGGDENPEALWEPDEITDLAAKLAELNSATGKPTDAAAMQQKIAEAVAAATKPLQSKLSVAEKAAQQTKARWEQAILDRETNAALAEAGVLPQYLPLMRQHLRSVLAAEEAGDTVHTRVRGETGDGYRMAVRASGAMEPVSPAEFVRDVVRTQYPICFVGDGASGAGVNSNGSRSGGQPKFRITASELAKDTGRLPQLEAQAKAAGQTVEVVDG